MRNIICIDPGTANTGIVYMNEKSIICCKTIHNDNGCKNDNKKLQLRAQSIAQQIMEWIVDKPHDIIIIEGFVTFGSSQRNGCYAFQTPFLVGYLLRAIEETGKPFLIQTSNQVFGTRQTHSLCYGCFTKKEVEERKLNLVSSYEDGSHCTNEHLRSAACHGIYYLRTLNDYEQT